MLEDIYEYVCIRVYIYIYIYIFLFMYVIASKCSRNHFISETYKKAQSFKLHPFKIFPFCNFCQRLWRCCKSSWKPCCERLFSFSVAFLIMTVATQKHCSSSADFIWENRKNQLEPGQESMGDIPVLSHCYLIRNPWPKPASVLEHCHEGETNCWFSIFQGVSFLPHP